MANYIIPGDIIKGKEIQGVSYTVIRLAVDDLMNNNTPHINFWTFLILNNLVYLNDDGNSYSPKINGLELILSEDKGKNEFIFKMMEKFQEDFWTEEYDELLSI